MFRVQIFHQEVGLPYFLAKYLTIEIGEESASRSCRHRRGTSARRRPRRTITIARPPAEGRVTSSLSSPRSLRFVVAKSQEWIGKKKQDKIQEGQR